MGDEFEDKPLKTYICKSIDEEKHENEGWNTRKVEKWKSETFSEFWVECDEEKALAMEGVRMEYAEDYEHLSRRLQRKYKTERGFTYFQPYYHTGYRSRYYSSGDRCNRLYVLRSPRVDTRNLDRIEEMAKEHGTLFIKQEDVGDTFGDEINTEYVTPVSKTCLYKPPTSQYGPARVVYNPKQVKQITTRNANDKVREEERRQKAEVERKKFEEAQKREVKRRAASDARRDYLYGLYEYLEACLNAHLAGLDFSLDRKFRYSKPYEHDIADYIPNILRNFDVLKVDAASFMVSTTKEYKDIKDHLSFNHKSAKKVRNSLKKVEEVLHVYVDAWAFRDVMSQNDNWDPEKPVDDLDDRQLEREKRMASNCKDCLDALIKLRDAANSISEEKKNRRKQNAAPKAAKAGKLGSDRKGDDPVRLRNQCDSGSERDGEVQRVGCPAVPDNGEASEENGVVPEVLRPAG
jgi:hypothetical protein